MPLNTPLHPMSITSITLCAVFTGLSSFWLVPMSTVPSVEGLHLWKHIAIRVTHHPPAWYTSQFLASLGGPQLIANGLNHGSIPPWLKPKSASVLLDKRKQVTCFHIRRVSRLDQEVMRSWQDADTRTSCSPTALGYSECCTLLSLSTLPCWKLKPSTSEDVHLLRETLYPFPEALSMLCPGIE